MNHLSLLFLSLAGVCAVALPAAAAPKGITVQAGADGLSVSWGGQVRLAGGRPRFEAAHPELTAPRREKDEDTFHFPAGADEAVVEARRSEDGRMVSFSLTPGALAGTDGTKALGLCFDALPRFRAGVSLWRYKPWKAWTKPVPIRDPKELQSDDVQFFYWRYEDGTYGAALPLCGQGYRTTLGQAAGAFGARSRSYVAGAAPPEIPQLTVGFGKDPYALFSDLYAEGLARMGHLADARTEQSFPHALEYLGWCTWNASDNGRNLNAAFLLDAAQRFHEAGVPLGWVLIDDGWLDSTNGRLNSFAPNHERFPEGFGPVVAALKSRYGIRDVGIWTTLNGHWNGINPDSPVGRELAPDLFSWTQKESPDQADAPPRTYQFLKPDSPGLEAFYDRWYRTFRDQGLSFVKIDNQLVVERMAAGNYPIWNLAGAIHGAANRATRKYFDGTAIQCMDMTPDAYYQFAPHSVARAVEDYFPYHPGEGYDLQHGNAAAHVLQATYNALYFGQLTYPDFDMFQSHHPNAVLHALARAANNGPIYLTDLPGQSKPEVIRPLVYGDGRIIRSDTPLLPTEDCLFQVQEKQLFKAFSLARGAGVLAVLNLADADTVRGGFSPADVHGLEGDQFAVYEHFSGALRLLSRTERVPVELKRMGYQLYTVAPLRNGIAPLGLVDKYNSPATLLAVEQEKGFLAVQLYDGGRFAAASTRRPDAVVVDGAPHPFTYRDNLLTIDVPKGEHPTLHTVAIRLGK